MQSTATGISCSKKLDIIDHDNVHTVVIPESPPVPANPIIDASVNHLSPMYFNQNQDALRRPFDHYIGDQLTLKEKMVLAKTNKYFYWLFQPQLDQEAAKRLLEYVLQGNQDKAEQMIKANPRLLLIKATATDYSGRTFKGTVFQAALCMQDVEMCNMLQNPSFSAKERETKSQYDEIFPNGSDAYFSGQRPFDFSALVSEISQSSAADIKAALRKQQNNTPVCHALNQFRNDFDALSHSEMVFNPQHLLKALQIYNEQFDNWDWDKRDLFWRQVIGYVQRYLPACFAQATAQGIYYITENNEALLRSFDVRFGGGSIFPFLPKVSCSGLGFDFACAAWRAAGLDRAVSVVSPRFLEKLCRAKASNLGELSAEPQQADASRCIIF